MTDIYMEIKQERIRQDKQWGGPEHDDTHGRNDWCDFLKAQLHKARHPILRVEFRERMVKIAALAVAAIETFDRKFGER